MIKIENFYMHAKTLAAYCGLGAAVFLCYGLLAGLFIAPIDYQQKEAVRIMYIHVPCAILSLTVYTIIGVMSLIYLIWKIKIVDIVAQVSASFGAAITIIALITGALWGKPMWGAWWVWDARLTSELILLFLYFGYMALRSAINDARLAASVAAIIAVVGLIDIPIIHFSVDWWHTLHQGASLTRFAKPSIDMAMLFPLCSVILGMYLLYAAVVCIRAHGEIAWRERNTKWVRDLLEEQANA